MSYFKDNFKKMKMFWQEAHYFYTPPQKTNIHLIDKYITINKEIEKCEYDLGKLNNRDYFEFLSIGIIFGLFILSTKYFQTLEEKSRLAYDNVNVVASPEIVASTPEVLMWCSIMFIFVMLLLTFISEVFFTFSVKSNEEKLRGKLNSLKAYKSSFLRKIENKNLTELYELKIKDKPNNKDLVENYESLCSEYLGIDDKCLLTYELLKNEERMQNDFEIGNE